MPILRKHSTTAKEFFLSLDEDRLSARYARENLTPFAAFPGNETLSREEAADKPAGALLAFLDKVRQTPAQSRRIVYTAQTEDEDGLWLTP